MWGRLPSPRWGRGALGVTVGALVLATGGAAGPAAGWSTTHHIPTADTRVAAGTGSAAPNTLPYGSLPPTAAGSGGVLLAPPSTDGRHRAVDASAHGGLGAADRAQVVTALAQSGIPVIALRAYRAAQADLRSADPSCHLSWTLLAAIGRVESNHGRFGGAQLLADGQSQPPVIGIALDGAPGIARVPDTDHGRYDGDTVFDHAVGAMQFLPSTWQRVAVDGNGDGVATPMDIFDAAPAAGIYLCAGDRDLATQSGLRAAVFSYNHSQSYVDMVLALMRVYQRGGSGVTLPTVTVPATATPVHVPKHPLPPATTGSPPGVPGQRHHPGSGAASPAPTTKPAHQPTPKPSPSGPPESPVSPSPSPSPTPTPSPTGSPTAAVPAVPGPVQVAMAGGELTATWQAPQGSVRPDRYRALLHRDDGVTAKLVLSGGQALTAKWPGLAAGHHYTVSVQAGNAAGFGAARRSATVTPSAPGPATSVVATGTLGTAGTDGTITLSFAGPESDGGLPVTGYRVAFYRDGQRAPLSTDVVTDTASVVSAKVPANSAYHYVVTARNAAGAAAAVVSDHVTLVAPEQVAAAVGADGTSVTWQAPSGGSAVTGYLVSVLHKDGTPALPPVTITGADKRTYTAPSLPAGSYVVSVTATYGSDSRSAAAATPFTVP